VELPVGTYSFERDGKNSVSFGGQTTRLNMADELYDGMNSNESSTDMLMQQFKEGTGFSDPSILEGYGNAAGGYGPNLIGKVASGCLNEKNEESVAALTAMIEDFGENVIPAWNTPAADGSPGYLSDDIRTIQVNSKGWELDQTFQKGLIGAFSLDQIVNNYLQPCKLDADGKREANTNGVVAEDKPFTMMEHAWDEAFGYVYGQEPDPTADLIVPGGDGTLLNKYLKKASTGPLVPGIARAIFGAFIKGRQAIVDGDYEARDEQAKIIQMDLSRVIGALVDTYLNAYLDAKKAGNPADAIHALSEAYGFIFSLAFTNNGDGEPYFTQEEVGSILQSMDNFWQIKDEDVQAIINEVDERFGFKKNEELRVESGAGDDAGEGDDAGDPEVSREDALLDTLRSSDDEAAGDDGDGGAGDDGDGGAGDDLPDN